MKMKRQIVIIMVVLMAITLASAGLANSRYFEKKFVKPYFKKSEMHGDLPFVVVW